MKKIISIIITTLFAAITSADVLNIKSKKEIVNKEFYFQFIIGASDIKFFDDNTYKIYYGSEGWYWNDEGRFEIKNGKVILSPTKCTPDEKDKYGHYKYSMGEGICTLSASDTRLDYVKFLKCKSIYNKKHLLGQDMDDDEIEYYLKESAVPEGSQRMVGNIKVITMGLKTGITTGNVKIRKGPFVKSKSIIYQKFLYDGEDESKPFVPKNTEITIIARTLKKEKVLQWNNYWYYVNVGVNDGVWMFAEFVKIK